MKANNKNTSGAKKSTATGSGDSAQQSSEIMVFEFSKTKQSMRNQLINGKPWFVAKDTCSILGLNDTNKALQKLDKDEKLTRKIFVSGQNRKMWLISESGLYALILRSNKPEAKIFRKWITSEVIPTLLKKGYYSMNSSQSKGDYFDARDIPYTTQELNDYPVRAINLPKIGTLFSINDLHRAIRTSTGAEQTAKKLNAKTPMAYKVWLYGNTNPAWFTTSVGVQLIISGSRILKDANQLKLSL